MSLKKFRWSQVYESSEEELIALLDNHKLEGERIHAEAATELTGQLTKSNITIWCAEGSLVIKTASTSTSLQAGDALRIASDTTYSAYAGLAGCAYYLTR